MSPKINSIISFVLLLFIVGASSFFDADFANNAPTYLEGKVGSYVVFNCPIDYPQDIEIPFILHWNKDGNRVFNWYDGSLSASDPYIGRLALVGDSYGYGKASINLTSIRESDSGWYECRVIFPNRTPSVRNNGSWFHLEVEGGSLIRIPPINQTVMEGELAFFHCVTKFPESYSNWYKDGIPLTDLYDLNQRSIIGSDGSLTINPTEMNDLGEYVCVVKSIEGEEQEARAFLNVQYKAKVVYAPSEVYLPYGKSAILDCHFRANPPLKNLRWEKDGFLFDPYNVQGVFYKRNGSLHFSKVDETHAGRYSCTPSNSLGTEGPSSLITVVVQRPPIFTVKPKAIYVHKLGDTGTFHCDATDPDGTRHAVVQWRRKDGTPLPFSRVNYEGTNITIENINETDRGIYQCTATNEAATTSIDTELLIENVAPRPPYNLTANSTDTAITLRWEPGYIRTYLEYIVWYRQTNATEWRTMRLLSKNNMQATITNLEPGQEYEFMVLSQDRFGDGMFSKAFRYFTKVYDITDSPDQLQDPVPQFAQIGVPRNLTVNQTSASNEFVASWNAPAFGEENLKLYVVRWWREPGHILQGVAETRNHYYVVKDLLPDELYRFQVFSVSNQDYQAGSMEFDFIVPPYRRARMIAIGSIIIMILMLTFASMYIYVKKRCFEPYPDPDEKPRP